jgi:hypothetical protein
MAEHGEVRQVGGGPRVYVEHMWYGFPPILRRGWIQPHTPELVEQLSGLADGVLVSIPDLMAGKVIVVRDPPAPVAGHSLDDDTLEALLREADCVG